MKNFVCDICGKTIPESNAHRKLVDGVSKCLCGKHYSQFVKYGKFTDISQKCVHDSNDFKIDGDITYIYTTTKSNEVSGYFIIDTEDLDRVIVRKWRLWKNRFFTGVQKPIAISHFILDVSSETGFDVDHINQNPADNRKANLRLVKHSENLKNLPVRSNNTSGFTGLHFNKKRNKWEVEIKANYERVKLGRYELLEDACYARYVAELILFKDFRSTTNDKAFLPIANNSTNKESIKDYVTNKIKEKNLFI